MKSVASTIEWPTWLVIAGVYGGWLALTLDYHALPVWLFCPAMAFLLGVHGSLQHEAVHGHPTRSKAFNRALMYAPVALWIPYDCYRESHLAHHGARKFTVPGLDSESFYVTASDWQGLPRRRRWLLIANNTLLGRMLLGPWLTLAAFFNYELHRSMAESARRRLWLKHLAFSALVLGWVGWFCQIPLAVYLLGCVLPSISLTLLRSFTEHVPATVRADGIVSIKGSWLTRLLFLNNNFHKAHHSFPREPWYRLPSLSVQTTDDAPSYAGLFARYLLRVKHPPVHPATSP